ncbi:hypothetical protein PL75_04685 [Neisseria arctica]|uniref:Uncharacterized protein n=1 Tax=Neisseria arctica TaxID=1470200 RepID=A0A0J0YSW2_9NEIS|nr:hypothetical protein PL75_04685 [Neisseria arctica]
MVSIRHNKSDIYFYNLPINPNTFNFISGLSTPSCPTNSDIPTGEHNKDFNQHHLITLPHAAKQFMLSYICD